MGEGGNKAASSPAGRLPQPCFIIFYRIVFYLIVLVCFVAVSTTISGERGWSWAGRGALLPACLSGRGNASRPGPARRRHPAARSTNAGTGLLCKPAKNKT